MTTGPGAVRSRLAASALLVFTTAALAPPLVPALPGVGPLVALLIGRLLGQRIALAASAYIALVFFACWLLGACSGNTAMWSILGSTAAGLTFGRIHDLRLRLMAQTRKREAAETELQMATGRNQALIRVLPDGICRIDRVGTILDCHAKPAPHHDPSHISEVLPKEGIADALECIQAALSGDDTVSFSYELADPPACIEARISRGGAHDVIAVLRDVTVQRRLERELKQAQQDALQAAGAKGRFLATMSHQIRTPMNGVVGMTNVLLQTNLTTEQREHTIIIRNCGEALLSILDDVLDYAKIEGGAMQLGQNPFPLRGLLEEVTELLSGRAHAHRVEIASLIDARIPDWILGDRGKLRQVITNLVGNAVKFTQAGQIALRATLVGHDRDTALIRFDVSDTGVGIPGEQQKHLFQDFSQANRAIAREFGGTGLGLSISRRIVEAMGGRLHVESAEGRGSTFSFTARLHTVQDRTTGSFLLPRALSGAHILALSLHPLTREFLEQQLAPFGVKMQAVPDAAALQTWLREGGGAELVLLELALGCDEGEAEQQVRRIAALCRATPLAVLFGSSQRGLAERARQAGASVVLPRPLRRAMLHESLIDALGLSARRVRKRRHEPGRVPAEKLRARVLVVEDNLVNQKVAVRSLEILGCDTQVADNGALALEAVRSGDFDVILMDCQMPVMDGYEATRTIRGLEAGRRHTPIIAMTANAMQGDRQRCIDAGMDDYMSKPVTLAMLEQTLRQWLPESVSFASRGQAATTPASAQASSPLPES